MKYFLFFLVSVTLYANTKLPYYKKLFYQGDYVRTLQYIENKLKQKNSPQQLIDLYYWAGLSHNRLQEYKQAAIFFSKTLRFKNLPKDLHYEFGQSLMAMKKLKRSKLMFALSSKKNVMKAQSLYYLSTIYQQEKKPKKRLSVLKALARMKSDQVELIQIAALEAGMLELKLSSRKKRLKTINHEIMPLLISSYRKDTTTETAQKLKAFQNFIKYNHVDRIRMRNGRTISRKEYSLSISQDVGYDSNVIQEANEADEKATDKESLYHTTSFNSHWRMPLNSVRHHEYVDLDLSYEKFLDSDSPDIYENNNYTIAPSVSSFWEHTLFNQQSNFSWKVNYQYHARDYEQKKSHQTYSKTTQLTLAERIFFADKGNFSFSFNYELVDNYNDTLDAKNYSLFFSQSIRMPPKSILFISFKTKLTDTNDSLYKNRDHTLSISNMYLVSDKLNIKPSFDLSFVEYINQKSLRGVEKKFVPQLEIQYNMSANLSLSSSYSYTRNASKSKSTYDYEKHTVLMGLAYKI